MTTGQASMQARQPMPRRAAVEREVEVLAQLGAAGSLRNTKDYVHSIGVHGKCDTIIEPMVSRQWFVKIKPRPVSPSA